MPFDRLIRAVDAWARSRRRTDVFAQIGQGAEPPGFIQWTARLEPKEFYRRLDTASVVIGHAGMGTIISALSRGKPLLVFPRRGDLRETRNDHQIATAQRFRDAGTVMAAFTESELHEKLDLLDGLKGASPIGPHASPELIDALRTFFAAGRS